jgi:hypothetical protein
VLKPVTDEQVFYDKVFMWQVLFARLYAQLWQVFLWQVHLFES